MFCYACATLRDVNVTLLPLFRHWAGVKIQTGYNGFYEMLFIKKKRPCLNTQSDSVRAKLFT